MKAFFTIVLTTMFAILMQTALGQSEEFDKALEMRKAQEKKAGAIRPSDASLEIKIAKPEGYPAKDLPENYTGFRIEIMATDTLLADTSEVFSDTAMW